MRYMVEKNFVQVIGKIWQPGCRICAYEYPLTSYDLENIGELNRENVEQWLCSHAGDFQSIKDFRVSVQDIEIPWNSEESEMDYSDCMFPCEDEG